MKSVKIAQIEDYNFIVISRTLQYLFFLLFWFVFISNLVSPSKADQSVDLKALDLYLFGESNDVDFYYWGGSELRILPLIDSEYQVTVLDTISDYETLTNRDIVVTNQHINILLVIDETFDSIMSKHGDIVYEILDRKKIDDTILRAKEHGSHHIAYYLLDDDNRVIFCLLLIEGALFTGENDKYDFQFPWQKVVVPIEDHSPIPRLSSSQIEMYFKAPLRAEMSRDEVLAALAEQGA